MGSIEVGAPAEVSKGVGGMMMLLAVIFSVSLLLNVTPALGMSERWGEGLTYTAFASFIFTHMILIAGECCMVREIWRSGTSMLITWGTIGSYVIAGFMHSVMF